jgi:hypothetical protein
MSSACLCPTCQASLLCRLHRSSCRVCDRGKRGVSSGIFRASLRVRLISFVRITTRAISARLLPCFVGFVGHYFARSSVP